jgi:hypothetical protein
MLTDYAKFSPLMRFIIPFVAGWMGCFLIYGCAKLPIFYHVPSLLKGANNLRCVYHGGRTTIWREDASFFIAINGEISAAFADGDRGVLIYKHDKVVAILPWRNRVWTDARSYYVWETNGSRGTIVDSDEDGIPNIKIIDGSRWRYEGGNWVLLTGTTNCLPSEHYRSPRGLPLE